LHTNYTFAVPKNVKFNSLVDKENNFCIVQYGQPQTQNIIICIYFTQLEVSLEIEEKSN